MLGCNFNCEQTFSNWRSRSKQIAALNSMATAIERVTGFSSIRTPSVLIHLRKMRFTGLNLTRCAMKKRGASLFEIT